MTQTNVIIKAMLDNPQKKEWYAKDFQSGKYFVGYEASARMSEVAQMYPELVNVGRDGRFRTLSINESYEGIDDVKQLLDRLEEIEEEEKNANN